MASPDPKIIDLLNAKTEGDAPFTSLEYFPPRSEEGVANLYSRMERMKTTLHPLFTDVTWGAGGSTADLSLRIAQHAHETGHVCNLHLTCTNLTSTTTTTTTTTTDPKAAVRQALETALLGGIRNIVALRGDPPSGQDQWVATNGGFECALDLVEFIRAEFGDAFGISVAGYPEGHPNAISELDTTEGLSPQELLRCSTFDGKYYCCKDVDYAKEMDYLKRKVDAGADFIMTQMFFDVQVYKQFVTDCRSWGIHCPVVPGLMCINAYAGFKKMAKFCKTRVPQELHDTMESLQDDAEAVKAFGIAFGANMCKELLDFGIPVLHFYTLNLEKVVYGILDATGLSENAILAAQEDDAQQMVAVGSAWARVGDKVKSVYGIGVVTELRDGGAAVIHLESWLLAGGQQPTCYLQVGTYEKVFS